jgi:signal transduction histidine kinase
MSRKKFQFLHTNKHVDCGCATVRLAHYWRERRLLEEQLRLTSSQLSQMLASSLRHAMLVNDREMIANVLLDVGAMENVRQIQILDLDGQVKVDSRGQEVGQIRHPDDLGCQECHQFPPETRPNATKLKISPNFMRISTPIANEPRCAGCHSRESSHLGVLLADVSLDDIETQLLNDLQIEMSISIVTIGIVISGMYLLIHRLIVRRVVALRGPLAKLTAGDFSVRLPVSPGPDDELDRHTKILNQLADKLERHTREQEERSKLRQWAIVEERERIARELHDGMAQLLGYLNIKVITSRLMLKKNQMETADQHLLQLEEAIRNLSNDVYEAVLSLKTTGQDDANLTTTLNNKFTTEFSRFSSLPVEFTFDPAVETLPLTAETELQLLRIVQESLSNIRKHASATLVQINIQIKGSVLELRVSDNGWGFDPEDVQTDHRSHFGLSTMRERAETIKARFNLDSKLGDGTRITVQLPLKETSPAQPRGN